MSASRDSGGLHVALEDLRGFRIRVDGLLAELDASEAAPQRIGEQRITPARFGTGFGDAYALATAYAYVHDRLEALSQTLADQIEAMSLVLRIGHATFTDVDLGTQHRLLDLNDRILRTHGPVSARSARRAGVEPGEGSPG
ncbi:hypothetical protein [Streptomyces sp. NRRL F-5123]|uniref:hypothetical protein n=1 Tax=Streptomyces sp. NRRL F-5123 TaxID=1463856 RepID=UPI000693845D|nr:hypothetical protein [Streptomyces sp. NRRL F-5123]